jgi:hypothetical protein
MDQFNDDHAYQILSKAFGDTPYIQHEYWGIHRDFKLDPIWSDVDHGVPNQVRTGDEGTTIPSVAATR